jgi:Tol biopolymer transport system component
LAKSNYSSPTDYPQGAELYTSDLAGHDVHRLTDNSVYDAEVSVAANGKLILFGSQRSGKMELWRAKIDGSDPAPVTHLDGWEPGGAFLFPDSKTVIFHAWRSADAAAHREPLPMSLFTINVDGTGLKALTHDEGTNWGRLIFASKSDGRNTHYFPGVFDTACVSCGFHYRSCYP